jgi:hypothetical protein
MVFVSWLVNFLYGYNIGINNIGINNIGINNIGITVTEHVKHIEHIGNQNQ